MAGVLGLSVAFGHGQGTVKLDNNIAGTVVTAYTRTQRLFTTGMVIPD
jgi:hypothetical protein